MPDIFYKTFKGPLENATGAYARGLYDLTKMPVTLPAIPGEPSLCEHGYHFCARDQLVFHLSEHICVVDVSGCAYVRGDDKCATCGPLTIVSRNELWTEQTARLFACDCAERVLNLANDERCDGAVRVARRYALGDATNDELRAARNAAWNAARYAAWASAMNAARNAARDAAWNAARKASLDTAGAAAKSAAWDAAGAAAWSAERAWQTELLFEYLEGRRTADDVRREIDNA